MRVLLLSRYRPLIKPLTQGLQEEGFTVEVAPDLEEGREPAQAAAYDALLLDLVRPQEAGLARLAGWRRAGVTAPVLVLMAPGGSDDLVRGLDSGADDWLAKPFEMDELLTRLRALVRRHSAGSRTQIPADTPRAPG